MELRVALAADAANGNGVRPTRRGSVAVRVRRSLLSFVDLAGSERQKMAGTEGERLAEGAAINKSLLALSKVVGGGGQPGLSAALACLRLCETQPRGWFPWSMLCQHCPPMQVIYTLAAAPSVGSSTAPYVPYRDSVLTRLLHPSLGGNSRTGECRCMVPLLLLDLLGMLSCTPATTRHLFPAVVALLLCWEWWRIPSNACSHPCSTTGHRVPRPLLPG